MSRSRHRPLAIAHRGACLEAPENTIAAVQRAVESGADVVEVDVHLAADGVPVVIHDFTVDRTTDRVGPVAGFPSTTLARLDAGSWFDPAYRGQHVPTLAEILASIPGEAVLAVELKGGVRVYPGIVASVLSTLEDAGCLDRVIVLARDIVTIRQARRLKPALRTSCFACSSPRLWRRYRRAGLEERWPSDYLFVPPEQLDAGLVDEVHGGGRRVVTSLEGTRPPPADRIAALAATGVDGILADDIRQLVRDLRSAR